MAFEGGPPETGRAFPRGLVLGFTMAEIFILVIFVLLAAMLARELTLDRTERELDQHEEVRKILKETEAPQDPEVLRSYLVERVERFEAADNWRELVRELEATFPEPSAQDLVNRIQESEIGRMSPAEVERLLEAHREVEQAAAHAELEQALQDADVSPSAGELRDMAAAMRAADEQGMTPEEVRDAIENRADWGEAVDDAGRPAEPEELRPLLDAVRAATEQGLSPEQVANAVEVHEELARALDSEGSESTEETVKEAIQNARRWREMGGDSLERAMEGPGAPASPGVLREIAATMTDAVRAGMSPGDVREAIESRPAQASARGGSGTDHPSCWYREDAARKANPSDSKPLSRSSLMTAYLFDIALTSRGLFVDFSASVPDRVFGASGELLGTVEEARALLPVGSVSRQQLVTPEVFRRQTKPVHDLSMSNHPECRFFVRFFDRTAEIEKQRFKDLEDTVQEHFYTFEIEDEPLPPGLARALGR